MTDTYSRRAFAGMSLAGMAGLSACATPDPLESEMLPMGNFQLGFNIVVAKNAKKVPPSRNTTTEELEAVMKAEIDRRFGAYRGGKDFHIAINIDGYALAPPGIPVVLTPKSLLVVSANVWSAEEQRKLHAEPEQFYTFEGVETLLLGSGLVKDASEQLQTLARNTARKIQGWMLRNPQWFDLPT